MSENTGSLIVTGIDGFVGRHVARQAKAAGMAVHGIGYSRDLDSSAEGALDTYIAADLRQGWPSTPNADAVIHLAALAAVGPSFDRPQEYNEANSSMVTHMAESLFTRGFEGTVLAVGSGAVYEPTEVGALTEASPIGVTSPYVVSQRSQPSRLRIHVNRRLSGNLTITTRLSARPGTGQPDWIRPGHQHREDCDATSRLRLNAPLP